MTREAVLAWRRFSFADDTEARFRENADGVARSPVSYRHVEVEGAPHLLFTAAPAFKTAWLRAVVDALETVASP